MKLTCKLLFILTVFFLKTNITFSQNPVWKGDSYSIVWKDEISQKKTKPTFVNFILGENRNNSLIKPIAITKTNQGNVFILDQGKKNVFIFKDEKLKTPKAFHKTKIDFASPVAICTFKNSNILFTDSKLNTVFYFNKKTKSIKAFNTDKTLNRPTGISYSPKSKEVWVVETGTHQISVFNEDGKFKRIIGKRGIGKSEFNFPTSIWADRFGNFYIVDTMNFRIQIFDWKGNFKTMFGEPGNATGYFARSKGIATDSMGNIYVTDALFHTVQIFDIKGNFLFKFGEQGRQKGQFWMPAGIYIDKNDYIYVADSFNARIQKFKLVKL